MIVTVERPKTLTVEDFKTQLFAGLVTVEGWSMLPRVPVVWGQREFSIVVTEHGTFDRVGFYDRETDGEELTFGWLDRVLNLMRGDRVCCTMHWRGRAP